MISNIWGLIPLPTLPRINASGTTVSIAYTTGVCKSKKEISYHGSRKIIESCIENPPCRQKKGGCTKQSGLLNPLHQIKVKSYNQRNKTWFRVVSSLNLYLFYSKIYNLSKNQCAQYDSYCSTGKKQCEELYKKTPRYMMRNEGVPSKMGSWLLKPINIKSRSDQLAKEEKYDFPVVSGL